MTRETRRWEYCQLPAMPEPSTDDLNALGEQGWELTAHSGPGGSLIFKRPAPGFRERITLDQRARVEKARAAE